MMRDYEKELQERVLFIKDVLKKTNAKGIIYGNSGGKDCTLVSILCKKACDNVLGVIMPCHSKRNFHEDRNDALDVANKFEIENITIDITPVRESILKQISEHIAPSEPAVANIAPRLRMTTLYTIAQTKGYLVAGTGNASEAYMGYFTKWGDGAYDFNPISDLTVGEIYEFLEYLKSPQQIITKAPSAGLYDGQTDEKDMGVSYEKIDEYIRHKTGTPKDIEKITAAHNKSAHKRRMPLTFENDRE